MFGTREELCVQLEKMFTFDEPLALLVWTEEGVRWACRELSPADEEITVIQAAIGNTDMAVYRQEGITDKQVCALLIHHRNRQVTVPADLLSRLVADAERELIHQEGMAWEHGGPTPPRIKQGLADVETLKVLLAA